MNRSPGLYYGVCLGNWYIFKFVSGALEKISDSMRAFTYAEGLPNHYEAVRSRLN